MFQNISNRTNGTGEPMAVTASNMIRSHSVSGDLHGVQRDPVAADILRKEPEQETFVRMRISPSGITLVAPFEGCNWPWLSHLSNG